MGDGIKSVNDPSVIETISAKSQTFHPSPSAWEDQCLYFLLPDRFSDHQEARYQDLDGQDVSTGQTAKYNAATDNANAIQTDADKARWLDAGTKFVGGNLKGLISKLGYLKRLGVTALWVGPVFKQVAKLETYHGYGVQDFLDIDPRFGTREELKELVATAHGQGIYVLLDIILNHSGNVFEYQATDPHYTGDTFDVKGFYDRDRNPVIPLGKVDEKKFPDAFPDAAVWPAELQAQECFTRKGQINDDGWDRSPEFLDGDFYDLKDLSLGTADPDNFTSTTALRTLCEVYKYWIAYADIDGYRIDTVKHMGDGPTRYFASVIHEFAQLIGKDRFLLIGEITGSRAFETVQTTGLDAALGIGNVQENLWNVPKGQANPNDYFDLFRNARYLQKGSHTWFRDKVVTMIDDHDQVWRGNSKGRFCSSGQGDKLVAAAVMLNFCTLGIPCIYYGTEQVFDGQGGGDQYIREAMFGGEFGAFRSRQRHFFDENQTAYKAISNLTGIRGQEMALRRGRQYLREISGDGVHYGLPTIISDPPMRAVVAWSRLFAGEEVLCAINTDPDNETNAWINVDAEIHPPDSEMHALLPSGGAVLDVQSKSGRSVVQLTLPAGGFAIYK